jgi:hypothetical protein
LRRFAVKKSLGFLALGLCLGFSQGLLGATKSGWIGKGGDDTVLVGEASNLPVSASENYAGPDLGSQQAALIFADSAAGAHDSILLKYNHKGGQAKNGEFCWVVASFSLGQPSLDLSGKNVLQFYLKGLPKDGLFTLALSDDQKKNSQPLPINKYCLQAADWTRVVIPMDAFEGLAKLDRKKISTLSFTAVSTGDYALYFDNMVFDSLALIPSRIRPWSRLAKPWAPSAQEASGAAAVSLQIDAGQDLHPISPYIYGAANAPEKLSKQFLTTDRWGGNANTRYNWKLGGWVSNAASDNHYMNTGHSDGPPAYDAFRRGKAPFLTIPTIGWVAKDTSSKSNTVATDAEVKAASREHPGPMNPSETSIKVDEAYMVEWVKTMKRTGPTPKFYAMDNEMDIWGLTHRDIHPWETDYPEIWDVFSRYSKAIKDADPAGLITGYVPCNWYFYFNTSATKEAARAKYGMLGPVPWFLTQCAARDAKMGKRYLDVLDIHYYAEGPKGPYFSNSSTDPQLAAARLRSVRSLYDPSYKDESWIGKSGQPTNEVMLIPRMKKWINDYYPGTKLGVTEYGVGALADITGALAQADYLGIFGREGVYCAYAWGTARYDEPGAFAFRMFTNYDLKGSKFGDTSVKASSSDFDTLSTYASLDSASGDLLVMVINKKGTQAVKASLNLKNYQTAKAEVYSYGVDDLDNVNWYPDIAVKGASFDHYFPKYSITLLRFKKT